MMTAMMKLMTIITSMTRKILREAVATVVVVVETILLTTKVIHFEMLSS